MTKLPHYFFTFSAFIALQLPTQLAAESVDDIQEYCQSMTSAGVSEEELQSFMNDCIAEQRSYVDQDIQPELYEDNNYESTNDSNYADTQYQESYEQDQHCYAKVDDHIQILLDTDPNSDFDYDRLLEQCLNGKL